MSRREIDIIRDDKDGACSSSFTTLHLWKGYGRGGLMFVKANECDCNCCFRKLLKEHSDDYDEERRANLIAVITQLHAMGNSQVDAVGFCILHHMIFQFLMGRFRSKLKSDRSSHLSYLDLCANSGCVKDGRPVV